MTMPRLLALIPLLLLLSACATTDQRVTIAPEPPRLEPAALGNAGAVALDVVDARDDRQLGSIQALARPRASPAARTSPTRPNSPPPPPCPMPASAQRPGRTMPSRDC